MKIVLATLAVAIALTACGGPRAHLGSDTGAAERKLFQSQVVHPRSQDSGAPNGRDGAAAELIWKRWHDGFKAPAAGGTGTKPAASESR